MAGAWERGQLARQNKMLILPKTIGHRGIAAYAPENTLAGLYQAKQLGLSWVEFDVMLTQDHEPIVIHDETLNRTTNGRGRVDEMTYADIVKLEAGSWFGASFAGEKIPHLTAYLDTAKTLGLKINVEIKPSSGKEVTTAQKVVEILQQKWPERDALLISSFSLASLRAVREIDPSVPLGLLLNRWFLGWENVLKELSAFSLHVRHQILSAEKVKHIHDLGYKALAYTVDDPSVASRLYEWGVDAVFSNTVLAL
ncbi:MAG: glycerophosphoryl diester phosphodiesterase [Gammaproteobacteria bacterium]